MVIVGISADLDEGGKGTAGGARVLVSSIFGVARDASTLSEKILKSVETAATFWPKFLMIVSWADLDMCSIN